jgi:hypothetical protein
MAIIGDGTAMGIMRGMACCIGGEGICTAAI